MPAYIPLSEDAGSGRSRCDVVGAADLGRFGIDRVFPRICDRRSSVRSYGRVCTAITRTIRRRSFDAWLDSIWAAVVGRRIAMGARFVATRRHAHSTGQIIRRRFFRRAYQICPNGAAWPGDRSFPGGIELDHLAALMGFQSLRSFSLAGGWERRCTALL